jgi:hypothetical protein
MAHINVNQLNGGGWGALGAVFINSPYISLLEKDCKTGVNAPHAPPNYFHMADAMTVERITNRGIYGLE